MNQDEFEKDEFEKDEFEKEPNGDEESFAEVINQPVFRINEQVGDQFSQTMDNFFEKHKQDLLDLAKYRKQYLSMRLLHAISYFIHVDKNKDYSSANILGTGEIGVMVRIWDKVARLMNLMGFRIKICSSKYEEPKLPKNESIEDTLLDLANYANIAFIIRKGDWAK